MADGSDMITYLLYAALVVVLAVAGYYIGGEYKEVSAVIGGLVGAGIVYYHSTSSSRSSYTF